MKALVLNSVETRALKKSSNEQVWVTRGNIDYLTDGTHILDSVCNVKAILPLTFGKNSILLTHLENKELNDTGKTTHVKGGKTYTITMIDGVPVVSIDSDFDCVITYDQTR